MHNLNCKFDSNKDADVIYLLAKDGDKTVNVKHYAGKEVCEWKFVTFGCLICVAVEAIKDR